MSSEGKVFGVDLQKIIAAQNAAGNPSQIPSIIEDVVYYIQANNVPSISALQVLPLDPSSCHIRNQYDQKLIVVPHPPNTSPPTPADSWLAQFNPQPTVQSMIAILKLFLQELPGAVTGHKHYYTFLRMVRVPNAQLRVTNIRLLLHTLPKTNLTVMLFLLRFLHTLTLKGVAVSDVAAIFGPLILRGDGSKPDDEPYVCALLKLLLLEYSFVSKAANRPLLASLTPLPLPLPPSATSLEDPSMSNEAQRVQARALYPFEAGTNKWLLALRKGDPVIVTDIKTEEGWLKGEIEGRGIGYFSRHLCRYPPGAVA